jgi:hypothetical protein
LRSIQKLAWSLPFKSPLACGGRMLAADERAPLILEARFPAPITAQAGRPEPIHKED